MKRYISLIFLFLMVKGNAQGFLEQGNHYIQIAAYDSAIACFNNPLQDDQLDDTLKAQVFIERGKAYQLKQEYVLALADFNKGLTLFQSAKNTNGETHTFVALAEFYRHLAKFRKARKALLKANKLIAVYKIVPEVKAAYYNRYAAVLAEDGGSNEDIIYYSNKAIEISKKNKLQTIEASSFNQLGYLFFNLKEDRAVLYFKKSLAIYKKLNDIRAQVTVIVNLARLYQIEEQYEEGNRYCDEGIALIKDRKWYLDLKELYHLKSACLYFLGRFEDAYNISVLRMNSAIAYINSQNKKALLDLDVKYDVKAKDESLLKEKKLVQIASNEAKNKTKKFHIILIGSIILFLFLTITFYFFFKSKKTNKKLTLLLKENEFLLGESNHRIKNNLQLITSILYQEMENSSIKEQTRLKEALGKIESISTLHKQLYLNKSKELISLSKYILDIKANFTTFFNKRKVVTFFEIENIEIEINKAMYIGLLVTELLINSLKHAFKDVANPTINMVINKKHNSLTLLYNDNGIGLVNKNIQPVLIDLLSKQLKTLYTIKNTEGFQFKINIKL